MLKMIPRRLLVEPRATVSDVEREGDDTTASLRIDGLVCSACAANVRSRLRQVPGVRAADVDLERGEALVRYESAHVRPDALIDAVEGAVVLPSLRRLLATTARAMATVRAARIAGRTPSWPTRFQ